MTNRLFYPVLSRRALMGLQAPERPARLSEAAPENWTLQDAVLVAAGVAALIGGAALYASGDYKKLSAVASLASLGFIAYSVFGGKD